MKNISRLSCLVAFFLCLSLPAFAAVTQNVVVAPITPNRGITQFLQGTDVAGTYKTVYTAGTNGSDISAITISNNDPSATHLMTCQLVNGGVKYGGAAITPVVNTGFANNVPPINLLDPGIWAGLAADPNGNPILRLISGDTLQCTFATALTASDLINVYVEAWDY